LTGKAEALSHGAATIVNAIATGKGGAVGVDLWTRAKVQLTDKPGTLEGNIMSDPTENPVLIEKTVGKVFEYFNLKERFGAKVRTSSNIPIARGLKSSSVAGNAIALATVAALDRSLDDLTVLNLSVDAAIEAKVTITGAFDDACASYFGGVVVTDNLKRRIVKRFEITENLLVLFHVPAKKVYTSGSDVQRMRGVASLVGIAYKEAVKGDYCSALTLNGLIYSSALGYNPSIAVDALMAGALAAGLSGTGPAVTAIVPEEKIDNVKDAWRAYEGDIIQARVNHEKAKVVG
jgi:shikimate kinase